MKLYSIETLQSKIRLYLNDTKEKIYVGGEVIDRYIYESGLKR